MEDGKEDGNLRTELARASEALKLASTLISRLPTNSPPAGEPRKRATSQPSQIRLTYEQRTRYLIHASHLGMTFSEFARTAMDEKIERAANGEAV